MPFVKWISGLAALCVVLWFASVGVYYELGLAAQIIAIPFMWATGAVYGVLAANRWLT